MLTRRQWSPSLDFSHAIQTSNDPRQTIMNARIGQLFDAIFTASLGLASISVVLAMAAGA
jgi:hypothetical protein